jgi:hypothetical protein
LSLRIPNHTTQPLTTPLRKRVGQILLSLRIPNHTTQPLTTPLRKRVGQIPLLPPLTRRRTSSKPTALKEHTLKWEVTESSLSPIFLALGFPSEPINPNRNQIGNILGKYFPYSNNPNYQASLHLPYHHRVLTESEQKAFEEEAPKVIQAYIKPKEEDVAPISSLYLSGVRIFTG